MMIELLCSTARFRPTSLWMLKTTAMPAWSWAQIMMVIVEEAPLEYMRLKSFANTVQRVNKYSVACI